MYILIIPSWQDEFTRFFIKSFFSCVIFMIKKIMITNIITCEM